MSGKTNKRRKKYGWMGGYSYIKKWEQKKR
jgi:hypothetical protein